MSRVDFESIRPLMSISDARMDAAYDALVLGRSLQVVADQHNWSRQAVYNCVQAVVVMHKRFEAALKAREKAIAEVEF